MTGILHRRRGAAGLALAGGLALATGLALLAGCTPKPAGSDAFRDPIVPEGTFRLVAFDSCEDALSRLKTAAKRYVGPWGFGGYGTDDAAMDGAGPPMAGRAAAPDMPGAEAAVPLTAPGAPGSAQGAPDAQPRYSGTNTHESGVDEPDLVKTDGRRILVVSQGVLRVVDPLRRTVAGTLDLRRDADDPIQWQAADLLLHGDHALILLRETGWGWDGGPMPIEPDAGFGDTPRWPGPEQVMGPRLLLVSLAGAPRIISEYSVDGGLVDARQVGSVVRVVVRSAPRITFPYHEGGTDAQRQAENRRIIDATGPAEWLPRYQVTTGRSTSTGQVECTAMSRPAEYSGTSMLTVLSFDLRRDRLGDGDPVTVVADGETVYSNGPSLYIASDQRWRASPLPEPRGGDVVPPEARERTEIYKFDTSQPGRPRYVASGSVDGYLINQYAMSEWDGHLRVATTTGMSWREGTQSESAVYVLAQRGDALVETGSVGGLGRDEQIYAVRYVGPVGYVVTFRQVDPLYTLDLRDPAEPRVLGELKITGYSAYLHPLGDGRLAGIGQEASEEGRVLGTQVSLFDVSDLANPTRLAQHHIRQGHSEAEFDPHAFLWWPARQLLVVPLTVHDWERREYPESTALLLRVGEASVTEVGAVSHPQLPGEGWPTQIRRSLVVEDTLWTVSDAGMKATALSDLRELAWLPFRSR